MLPCESVVSRLFDEDSDILVSASGAKEGTDIYVFMDLIQVGTKA